MGLEPEDRPAAGGRPARLLEATGVEVAAAMGTTTNREVSGETEMGGPAEGPDQEGFKGQKSHVMQPL